MLSPNNILVDTVEDFFSENCSARGKLVTDFGEGRAGKEYRLSASSYSHSSKSRVLRVENAI